MKIVGFCTLIACFSGLLSCSPAKENAVGKPQGTTAGSLPETSSETEKKPEAIAAIRVNKTDTLVRVDTYNKAILWDLKYATADNFMHRILYDTLRTVYI